MLKVFPPPPSRQTLTDLLDDTAAESEPGGHPFPDELKLLNVI
jgi:hypothetical protein